MRLLIDIGHPAHVHLFKNLAWNLIENGHKVLFTCRNRDHVVHLLRTYGFVYENYGRHYKSISGKVLGLVKNELQMLDTALRFKPDMFISHGSTIAAQASFLVRKPHIALEDTFNMEQVRLSMPFTDVVLTGDYEHPSLGKKEIKYPGYHELAYLHPNVFSPDKSVFRSLGVEEGEKYAVLRFVGWAATHDMGQVGLSLKTKRSLVMKLADILKVFISSEVELPADLQKHKIRIKPDEMHSVLAFAHLFVGEGATMASEAAVLGTPSIYVNSQEFGSTNEQAKYGLLTFYQGTKQDQTHLIERAIFMASNNMNKEHLIPKRRNLLADKIDVTAFLLWFIENYPISRDQMQREAFDFSKYAICYNNS